LPARWTGAGPLAVALGLRVALADARRGLWYALLMTEWSDDAEPVTRGLYDRLVTAALHARLEALGDPRLVEVSALESDDAHAAIAQHLERLIASSLSTLRGEAAAARQRRLVDRLIASIVSELGDDWAEQFNLADPLRRLLAVHASSREHPTPRPDTPLARSALLTGSRWDPSLASQLSKEFAGADRVDILCSFIKWSGLRLLLDGLGELTARPHGDGPRLRVVATSYMGATDPRAIEALRGLPNTEVKVSYDTERTRLHAKAFVVHRATGFGSAYIGSANISRAALSEGLEWTSKISQYELPHLWQKVVAAFEAQWHDGEFVPYGDGSLARLREAIDRERGRGAAPGGELPTFDLRPYPFQEEVLDALAAEREVTGKDRQLVVAATGTGKTMIAAFDYKGWSGGVRPSLLYIAHREEILRQALGTFRAVLRDHNFGDVLTGGADPGQHEHLFCSIQSYNSRCLHELAPDRFDYVVVDEFHHAAAPSYRRLLEHARPKVLLGLTATPERADGLDVLGWFGGEATAEIRLPDAINRRLLCPFQYFGVADSVDLDGLTWQRGGYRVEDLDAVYTGNDIRAGLVVDKIHETLLDPVAARGLGFCVSVAHAEFMARFLSARGIPSLALSSESPREVRRAARDQLVRREVNFIFVVDLYNEGVDIPEVDTVLFLRPTESLTVYLQQLGRGLRVHEEKECLTVLDFMGAQHRQFRFAARFRALSTDPVGRLEGQIESGFPHLPAGCFIRLERVAQQRVLENVRQSLGLRRPRMVGDVRDLGRHLGRAPTLREVLDYLDTTLDELLKRGLWSRLLAEAGLCSAPVDADEDQIARGIRRLAHIDDPRQIRFLLADLGGSRERDPWADCRRAMLHVTLWGRDGASMSLDEADARLRANPSSLADLRAVLDYRLRHTRTRRTDLLFHLAGPLALHAVYTRDEVLVGLGHWDMGRRPEMREGVLHVPERKVDAFFVTLHKTEAAYSPTTMYEDYAISDSLFHWQSQSTTAADSQTGQRYIHHGEVGYTPLLFVRDCRHGPGGLAAPYAFLGPADYVSHEGSRPMSIVWRLRTPMPARVTRVAAG
jgi:superfamily II DNA or RNA helicase/HKD family nuclease